MSDPEDGQKVQRGPGTKARPASTQTAAAPNQLHPLTPLVEAPEDEEEETTGASNNNTTIMDKMKKRLSILPAALSGWFSPSSKQDNAASPQDELHRQPNGCTKRKRGRRRIVLAAEADAEADDVDDGSDARGLNYEEVALADNITEHDLAAEDEQTRRSEYNEFLLRSQRDALAPTGGDEDDVEEDEDDDEEGDCDEDEEIVHAQTAKRRRLKLETTVSLPHMRRMPLSSSTPAASLVPASVAVGGARSNSNHQLAAHRRTHLNLYQNQRNREPAFNFFAGNEAAAEGTTGDFPHSIRRSLNIPFGSVGSSSSSATSRNNSSLSLSSLPNHKRPSLLGNRTERRDRQRDLIFNNNNNNVEKPIRQTDLRSASGTSASAERGDSNSESDPVELNFHDNGEVHLNHNNNNNSHLEFYGNLQSTKSLFNRTNAQPTLHNSTWSLNSLSNRRTFNATIYGSTSALSDSRLLSHRGSAASSASSSSSPFYQGPTAFGGNSANNRFFNRNTSGAASMPVQLTGLKPTEMRTNKPAETSTSGSPDARNAVMSRATHRILHLLDRYSTPLIDVKRMGSTLKEHQSSRRLRDNAPAGSPYLVPRPSASNTTTGSLQSSAGGLAELRTNKLLLPTMQQLLERRCLNRVTTSTRNLMQGVRAAKDSEVATAATNTVPSSSSSVAGAPAGVDQPPSHSHRTKMRSKLSHQTGRHKEAPEEEAAPPPLDLPTISFPEMASTPKFDLVIDKTPFHKTVVPTSKSDNNNISTSTKPNFLVNPQPSNAVSFAANGSATTAAKRVFTFSKPVPLQVNTQDNSGAQLSVIKQSFSFSAPIPLGAEGQQPPAMNGLPPQSFGELFKKSGKEWDCDVCMVRNKAETSKCVACESPKPGAAVKSAPAAAAATLFEQFKKSSKEWDCDVCMVRNKVEAVKCVACETPKPGATKPVAAPTPLPPIVPIGAGFGDRFKKSSTAWECEACMVTNKEGDTKCVACATPRKSVMAPKINNVPLTTLSVFGDAFKVKSGQWECQTCMLINESNAAECVACQSVNPRNIGSNSEPSSSSSSSSLASSAASAPASPRFVVGNSVSSSTSTSSFKFGFTPGTAAAAAAPKSDAGFQQLVAAQKAASWNCDACLAQNDMSRNKCLCCEQLKPGSSPTSTTNANSMSAGNSSGGNSVPKFTFGFAPAQPLKSAFTKEETKTTTATSSTEETDAAAPVSAPAPALSQQFVFRAPITTSSSASSNTATTTSTTSSSSSSSNTPALSGFTFGAPSSSFSTVSSSSTNSMPAAKPMFSFSGTGNIGAVSSTSSQQPATKTETLSFSGNNTITTTSSTGFSLKPAATAAPSTGLTFAAIPATASSSAAAPALAAAPAPAPAPAAAPAPSFSFGTQPKTVSTPAAAGTFFFGQPAAATPAAAPAANAAGTSSIFGSAAAASTSTAASSASTVVSSAVAVAPSNPSLFSFGGANKKPEETSAAKPFVFGSGGLGAPATTTTMSSFGWLSNGATALTSSSGSSSITSTASVVSSSQGIMMAQPTFASSNAMFGAPSSITSSSSSLFGSTATTAAATPAAVNLGGGNGGLATVFGNVGNSLGAPVATAAATPAAAPSGPLANMFGNPTAIAAPASSSSSMFGSGTGGFGQGAAAVTTPAVGQGGGSTKPAFNFGGAVAATATSSGAPFNFGSSTAAAAKPSFNFTGSVTASTPQAGAFTFTANPTATPLTAGDAAQSNPMGIFRFGASSAAAAAGMGEAVAGPEGAASSAAFGGMPPMYNFNSAMPQTQMQSTSNTNAPFQFGGAPAPANIFAFNQPSGQSSQNSQMVRRKVRTPMRRHPPR